MQTKTYRDKDYVKTLAHRIHRIFPGRKLTIMEVCGTHTMAIARYGLRALLPSGLKLISGPGCPVCVTPASVIDAALKLSEIPDTVICTFGDMMRVPGSRGSLELKRAEGSDIRVVYSVRDMLELAEKGPGRKFVFISVGFETTTPGTALSVMEAAQMGLKNVFFLAANRLVVPAMDALMRSEEARIDGFLCPGHVSVIIGSGAYRGIASTYGVPCVVGGFEPVDILMAVHDIVDMAAQKKAGVGNAYPRAVTQQGNLRAQDIMYQVFQPVAAEWRGLGKIPDSGMALREPYVHMDALKEFSLELSVVPDPAGCRCGDVLKGVILPPQCSLFGKRCRPEHPVGPCMVSSEGSCAAYYRYGGEEV
ncbi:MAG: hydrogenase formation protein HypD [Spirochaetota bacterium]